MRHLTTSQTEDRTYRLGFFVVLAAAVVVPAVSLPAKGYFDDVPLALMLIEHKEFAFGYPGYASYHYLINGLAEGPAFTFQVMVLASLACGIAAPWRM